jgi:hypothetical protein
VTFASNFTTHTRGIIDFPGDGYHFEVYMTPASPCYFYFATTSGGVTQTAHVPFGSFTIGQRYRLAVTKTGGLIYFFSNGTLLNPGGTAFNYTIDHATSGSPFYLGEFGGGTDPWDGYIDEIRISNVARWTASYTPAALGFDYQASGTIFTKVYDMGASNSLPATIVGNLNLPTNTSVTRYVRAAASLTDQSTSISAFSALPQPTIRGRYMQFAFVFGTTSVPTSPAVNSANVSSAGLLQTGLEVRF